MTPDLPPPIPTAPPTVAGQVTLGPRPSQWPAVIGILAIVLGALGMLGQTLAFFQPLVLDWMAGLMPPEARTQFDAQTGAQRRWMTTTMLLAAVQLLLALLLLSAGTRIVKRRRAGPRLAQTWAVLKMIAAVFIAYFTYLIQLDTMQAMSASMPAGGMFMTGNFALAGAVFSLLWLCAFPAFILVWLNVPSFAREIATWK